jgi:enamine deaminase RidA (YjgF/YER057c/UK114 family)
VEHHLVPELRIFEEQWHFSHAVASSGLIFLSGVTGTTVDGAVSPDPREQFEQTFEHLGLYLAAAGASINSIVEMTSYHVGLRTHLATFIGVKDRHIHRPYPAWSAIGVSELITPGALVEIRVVAAGSDLSQSRAPDLGAHGR